MNMDQITISALILLALALFIWNRWRYDMVALMVLFGAVLSGVVPVEKAFSGFADPVVTTVACILVLSAAISRSGFINVLLKKLMHFSGKKNLQVLVLVTLVAALSAFMNNVGALAVLMPLTLSFARKAERSPSELLMPLAFGSLLGGLITLIGTPPNILISSIRQQITGHPFAMFDFAPVGLGIAALGVIYLGFCWRLIPADRRGQALPEDRFNIEDYISEVTVPEESSIVNKTIGELEKSAAGDFTIVGLIRSGYRRLIPSHRLPIAASDILIVESDPVSLKNFIDNGNLTLTGSKEIEGVALTSDEVGVVEAVVTSSSEMIGMSPRMLSLRSRFGINVLAVKQRHKNMNQRLHNVSFQEGDVIVLQGNLDAMPEILGEIGCLPLAERNLLLGRSSFSSLPIAIMAIAVLLTVSNLLPISVAFLGAVIAIGVLKILRPGEIYAAIDASVIVLLAAMIPVTQALQETGMTEIIASWLAQIAQGSSPTTLLTLVLVASMIITPFLNNAATVLLVAPIAAGLAMKMGLSIDPFLMAVAVGASSDFLTPIGHQSNTLVMGPGGYKFTDYWRLGLPLSIFVVAGGIPLIMMAWPF